MTKWLENIIQIMPCTERGFFVDEDGVLESQPAGGLALYRDEDGDTNLMPFLLDSDGLAYNPTEHVNFIGWYSGDSYPTRSLIEFAMKRMKRDDERNTA